MQARPQRTAARTLDRADSVWNRAVAIADHGDPFSCRSEWQLSFHETFAPRRRLHLLHHGKNVAAFAESRRGPVGTLLEPIESSWLFGCPLLGSDPLPLLESLLADPDFATSRPAVLISGLLPDSKLRARLLDLLSHDHTVQFVSANLLVSASLEGGLDGYLSRRSARVRRNVRNARRRLIAAGVEFERHAPTTATEAAAIYRRMLAVEETSWKGIGECGMAQPPSREFYGLLLRRLAASGAGRVILARRGERDIGFIFGGMCGPIYRGQQFSYAEDWSPASLGNVLQYEQIRWLAEEGAERYDMGPQMPYKRHWTEIQQSTATLLFLPA